MAIAFDSSQANKTAASPSLTYSHTVTGSNPVIFVAYTGDITSDKVTGVTYAGAALSILESEINYTSGRYIAIWGLANCATGANNVVISMSSGSVWACSASYTGVSTTGLPDAHTASNTGASSVTSITQAVTTVADNCWLFGYGGGSVAGPLTAGTNSHQVADTAQGNSIDSNAAQTPAGSHSLQLTGSSQKMGLMVVSFAPFGAAASGPANLKSLDTNLKANIKSYNGNLIANIKSIDTNV